VAADSDKSIDELFEEGTAIDQALRDAAADARRLHKALGIPIVTWRDGHVVLIPPEEIVVDDNRG
jgi:hypothetical protein